jgi:sugar/nucleoside kinase (ribokinase family)
MSTTISAVPNVPQPVVRGKPPKNSSRFVIEPIAPRPPYRSLDIGTLVDDWSKAFSLTCAQYRDGWSVGDTKLRAKFLHRGRTLGGSAGNTARILSAMGFVPTVAANVGDDEPGQFIREQLPRHGVLSTYVLTQPGHTAESEVTLATDGHVIVTSPGVGELPPYLPVDDIKGGRFPLVTVSSLKRAWRGDALREIVKAVSACPKRLVIGVNIGDDWTQADFEILQGAPRNHIVFYQGNRPEYQSIASNIAEIRGAGMLATIRAIHDACGTPIVGTCGSDGCYCLNGDPRCLHVYAVDVPNPVTRVGLGDAHMAALGALLALGFDWESAARGAAVVAAHVAMGRRVPGFGEPADRVARRLLECAATKNEPRTEFVAVA